MSDEPEEESYADAVRRKAERMARARREKRSVWVALGHAGTIGWQFALPLVGCTLAGHAIARTVGHDGPTLAGILVGLVMGIVQAFRSIRASLEE